MKKIIKNPFVWAALVGCALITIYPFMARMRLRAPPPLLQVGEWQLIDESGKPMGSQNLEGKVVIADFFFTKCPSLCPLLTQKMKEVHQQFGGLEDKVHFISVSVDPETDTPEVLQNYRREHHITASNWNFMTGDKKSVYNLVANQLKLHVGDKKPHEKAEYDIDHVAQLVLLDQNGDLRGLFSLDPVQLAALERAAKLLIKQGA